MGPVPRGSCASYIDSPPFGHRPMLRPWRPITIMSPAGSRVGGLAVLRRSSFFTFLAILGVFPSVTWTQGTDQRVVEEALARGKTGAPPPYPLRFDLQDHPQDHRLTVGYVYTPFVRIATATSLASAQGRQLQAAELPSWITEPVAWVVLRWYCHGYTADDCRDQPARIPPGVGIRLVQGKGGYGSRDHAGRGTIVPLWVTADFALLESIGIAKPSADALGIAAFPMESIKSGYGVYACFWSTPTHCEGSAGFFSSQDWRSWK